MRIRCSFNLQLANYVHRICLSCYPSYWNVVATSSDDRDDECDAPSFLLIKCDLGRFASAISPS